MTDPGPLVALASAGTAAISVAAAAALRGWQGWLDVRRLQIRGGRPRGGHAAGSARAELVALRDRVRRLEAIANGADS